MTDGNTEGPLARNERFMAQAYDLIRRIRNGDIDPSAAMEEVRALSERASAVSALTPDEKRTLTEEMKARYGDRPKLELAALRIKEMWNTAARLDEERNRPGIHDLLVAVSAGDVPRVREIVAQGVNIEKGRTSASSLLVHAAIRQDRAMAEALRDLGAPIGPEEACVLGDTAAMATFIEEGSDPNGTSERGTPYLVLAAMCGRREMAALLLSRGAVVDAVDRGGHTALMHAAIVGHYEVTALLIDAGTRVGLHEAAALGATDEIERFLASGIPPDVRGARGMTPLMAAAAANQLPAARVLLRHGAGINAADDRKRTAVSYAVLYDREPMVRFLFEAGADAAPLADVATFGAFLARRSSSEMLRLALRHGLDPNATPGGTDTLLCQAELFGRADLARVLREAGGR